MKKYSIFFGLAAVLVILVLFVVFFFIPTDKQLGQNIISGVPVLQKITGGKSPSDIEATHRPNGIPTEKWLNTKYSYRLGGDLQIDEAAYHSKNPKDLIIHHKYGVSIYMMEKPSEDEIGPYREGLDL